MANSSNKMDDENNHQIAFHDSKKTNKRIVFRERNNHTNKALSLKSPSLNKRYRFSVLPTVCNQTPLPRLKIN